MSEKELHPSIKEFKQFVKNHPGLIKDVRSGNNDWQSHYEKWVLLGEDDPSWAKYQSVSSSDSEKEEKKGKETKEKKEKQEIMGQLMRMVENMDLNKVEGHMNQLNGAITNIQTLIGQFQDVKKQIPKKSNSSGRPPFQINKD
ncbi:YlbD family protein [Aquibacillus koreensis]|uniref:YlbD family protein n=1 Tax=Aquibacillus koreensis TaxID=279446 RepID=A0A9X4AHZ3_9BACI|nr:YlbD family protein [Aquibacillus koreensis]MCT2538084.1 YlbD family protein [Aquibacillus koreensis]MDC3420607.1 YlbD family protein [Aquibacillus koreensis]